MFEIENDSVFRPTFEVSSVRFFFTKSKRILFGSVRKKFFIPVFDANRNGIVI